MLDAYWNGSVLRQWFLNYEYNGGTPRLALTYSASGVNTTQYHTVSLGTSAHTIHVRNNGGTVQVFLNGTSVISFSGSTAGGSGGNGSYYRLGRSNGANYWSGEISHYTATNVSHSDDWISFEYTNHNTPTTAYTIGTQETDTGGGGAPPRRIIKTVYEPAARTEQILV